MPSPASLRRSADFSRVRRRGRRATRDGLTVYGLGRPDLGPPRVGLSVGRRCGGAVARNRLKRRLRAASRAAELPPGLDVVIQARPEATRLVFQEMVDVLRRAREATS